LPQKEEIATKEKAADTLRMKPKRTKGRRDSDDMNNKPLIHKAIWTIATTLFAGIVFTAGSILWSTNITQEQVKNTAAYTKENRKMINDNRRSIAQIKEQGEQQIQIQTEIATTIKYIAKENNTTNKILNKLVDKTDRTAIEQAKRTSAIKSIRRHVEDTALHNP